MNSIEKMNNSFNVMIHILGIGTTGGSNTSIILISIVKLQDKMKSMSKSMKTITVKENKLQTLQKKCANIEERLKDHRLKRRNLQGLLKQATVHFVVMYEYKYIFYDQICKWYKINIIFPISTI